MSRLRGLFQRALGGPPRPEREALARVKALARAVLGEDDATLVVNEIVCLDPGCPGTETVILVMRAGERTRAVSIAKPAEEVTEEDVRAALPSP